MHKFYTSSYDASIYLQQPNQNAGRDEILEVGKLFYGATKDINRTLIKFDTPTIETTGSWKAYINLKAAGSSEIPLQYTLYANAVSQSWGMGTGTKFDNITTDGVSWYYRDGEKVWMTSNAGYYNSYSPQSETGSLSNGGGGTWYTASQATQNFSYQSDDVRMDVSGIVNMWVSGSLPNNGFILHHGLDKEADLNDYGVLKFFSKETNTIYEPKLEIVWDDSSFTTGSLMPVTGSVEEGYKVNLTNLKKEYQSNSKVKIRVKGRDLYPAKSFTSTFQYDQSKYIPQTAYYQIEDYVTGEVVIPFDEYTKISCDSTSNYFILDLSTFPIKRVYKIKLKIVESGIANIIDNKLLFEVI